MKIASITFLHLALPFKGEFEHAQKSRRHSDTILVRLVTDTGIEGWGEILARSYVTGETYDNIMTHSCQNMAAPLIGCCFRNQQALSNWLHAELESCSDQLALFGGIEIALWAAMAQTEGVDLQTLLGPERSSPTGRCNTIGFDASLQDLRGRAINARLQQATVVKLKVGLGVDKDIERLQSLAKHIGSQTPLRLDGNGTFTLTAASELLGACGNLPISSFEEPLATDLPDLDQQLLELHARHKVSLMADESVCSRADAEHWITSGGYQLFNIRVGKHGGLQASRQIRDMAVAAGIGLVGGSMVGESGVLTQASRLLLRHSEAISYVEGLGQNRNWLATDPVEINDDGSAAMHSFHFRQVQCQPLLQASRIFN